MQRTALYARHVEAGAKIVPFGGWQMPLSYVDGTVAEHLVCRRDAAVFDVSHLGTVAVSGRGAFELLQRTLTNDLAKVEPGRAQYTHLLDEADASVLDDIIVWWLADDLFHVMPNASNTERVLGALSGPQVEAEDVTSSRTVLALQGPNARDRLVALAPEAARVPRFAVERFEWHGASCIAAGTGYTGEDGIECAVPNGVAESFWDAVVGTGFAPAGLGARDTLRLEAGLPLHGHELGPGITPLQAGLGWVVSWDKGDFVGRPALEVERERGIARRIRGLSVDGRRPPREFQKVLRDGSPIGEVTSGNFSPVLGHGVALAFVPPDTGLGVSVEVEARGSVLTATVVKLPFVESGRS